MNMLRPKNVRVLNQNTTFKFQYSIEQVAKNHNMGFIIEEAGNKQHLGLLCQSSTDKDDGIMIATSTPKYKELFNEELAEALISSTWERLFYSKSAIKPQYFYKPENFSGNCIKEEFLIADGDGYGSRKGIENLTFWNKLSRSEKEKTLFTMKAHFITKDEELRDEAIFYLKDNLREDGTTLEDFSLIKPFLQNPLQDVISGKKQGVYLNTVKHYSIQDDKNSSYSSSDPHPFSLSGDNKALVRCIETYNGVNSSDVPSSLL